MIEEVADWGERGVVAAGLAVAALLSVALLRRRSGFASAWRPIDLAEESGGITPFDLVLTAPTLLFLSILFFQFALLLKDQMVVHHAAISAARSARVHLCPPIPSGPRELVERLLGRWPCSDDREKPRLAANYALIAISPTSYGAACDGSCGAPEGIERLLAEATRTTRAARGWARQVRYAFDPDNVEVTVEPVLAYLAQGLVSGQIPIPPFRAEVRFRETLLPLMEPIFGKGRHRDGRPYTILTAEATIL